MNRQLISWIGLCGLLLVFWVSCQEAEDKHESPTIENSQQTKSISKTSNKPKSPEVSIKSGYYTDSITIEIKAANTQDKICYTLDGRLPDFRFCKTYKVPIKIGKTSLLKVIAFKSADSYSEEVCQLYVFESPHTFPLISLSIPNWEKHYNRNRKTAETDKERSCHIHLIDTTNQLVLDQKLGLSLAGHFSRRRSQKSISLHTRKKFGKKWINFPFFKHKPAQAYRGLVLRNDGNSDPPLLFKDAFLQSVARSLGTQDYLDSCPVVLYINGQYWGVYNVREKKCKHYFEYNYSLDGDSIDYLMNFLPQVKKGSDTDYLNLMSFVKTHDLANQKNLKQVEDQVDLTNFIDYQILEIYFANVDWPMTNIRYWKPQQANGKWRWILFDLDLAYRKNSFALNTLGPYAMGKTNDVNIQNATLLLRKLCTESPVFRTRFVTRFSDLLNQDFQPQSIIAQIDSFENLYSSEIPKHLERWTPQRSIEEWKTDVQNLRSFAQKRPPHIWEHIQNEWQLHNPIPIQISLATSSGKAGQVKVNSLSISSNWSGQYFPDFPLELEAQNSDKQKFSHWECTPTLPNFDYKSPKLSLDLSGIKSLNLTAHFK